MTARKTGFAISQLIRIPLVIFTLLLLFLLCKSSISLISAFSVPFGFNSVTTTAITTVAIIFFLSIGVLIGCYIFKSADTT